MHFIYLSVNSVSNNDSALARLLGVAKMNFIYLSVNSVSNYDMHSIA